MGASLPSELTRCLADAEVEVVSWAGEAGELVLRVTKDIGPEVGLLRFGGVAHVNLPPVFDVAGLTAGSHPDGETEFVFEESWGEQYAVVAETVEYQIDPM